MTGNKHPTAKHGYNRLKLRTGFVVTKESGDYDCGKAAREQPDDVPALVAVEPADSGNDRRGHQDNRKDRMQPCMERLSDGPHGHHCEYDREQQAVEDAETGQANADPVP